MDPINQASILGAGQALVPNYLDQSIKQQLAPLQIQNARLQNDAQSLQNQAARAAADEQGQFHTDLQQVMLHPSTENMAGLILRHPKYAEQVKAAHGMMDRAQQQKDLTSMGSVFAAASNGKYDLAANLLESRIAADAAAGHPPDATDAALLQAFKSNDPKEQKAAVGMIGPHLAALVGPDKFSEVYGALSKDKGFTLGQGQTRYDEDGNPIASIEAKPEFIVRPADADLVPLNAAARGLQAGGGAASGGGGAPATAPAKPVNMSPKVAEVASTLSGSLPAPVVAGFMGNFHAEGGYDGAQGDGGSSSGIMQLHSPDRLANFERVIGKPVTQASPTEQAKFVLWEMQNPQAAGMTVAQRDAILAAKTPAQAAALIDQYYERSSGKDRQVRMSAATAFAGGAATTDDEEGDTPPPSRAPSSSPGRNPVRPGDPPGTIYGRPKPTTRVLKPTEAQALGLDPKKVYEQRPDGTVSAIGDATANEVPMGNPNLSGDAYLKSLPGNIASQVKALAEGRLGLPSSFALAKPYWQRMLQATAQYDPTFDAQRAQARKSAITAFTGNGKGAQIVGSVNRAANHLNTLYQASEKLVGPDTGFSPLNALLAYGGQKFQPQDLKAYNSALPLVAGELEKIARGSTGTLHGVEQIMANLSPNESLATRRQAIKTAIELIHGAIEPLKNGYNSAFEGSSARPVIPWVDPTAQRIYKQIGGIDFSLDGQPAAPSGGHSGGLPAGAHQIGVSKRTGKPVYQLPDGRKVSPQ